MIDGPEPDGSDDRSVVFLAGPAGTTTMIATLTTEQAVLLRAVLDAYCDALRDADWRAARAAKHAAGDTSDVTAADLSRSERQRRADALDAMVRVAAGLDPHWHTPPEPETDDDPDDDPDDVADDPDDVADEPESESETGSPARPHAPVAPIRITLNLTMPYDRYLAELARLSGDPPGDPPGEPPGEPRLDLFTLIGPGAHVGTTDGQPLPAGVVAGFSLNAHVRRVVLAADGTVVDLGRRRRLFTGAARDAIMATNPRCVWAGCRVRACHCQADHLQPWAAGGVTATPNGAPLCGYHNRHKTTSGYRITRQPDGTFHTIRPDGTTV